VKSFAVHSFGLPLSERGHGIYREFLLQSKKYTTSDVDAVLASYAGAPNCR
jgi:hypothetical protein